MIERNLQNNSDFSSFSLENGSQKLNVYILSDSIGETAQQVANAAIAQFGYFKDYEVNRFPYVVDKDHLEEILSDAEKHDAIVIYTLASQKLQDIAQNFCQEHKIDSMDLLNPLVSMISQKTNLQPTHDVGALRKMDENYFSRMEAIQFAVKYDDGKDPRGILKADIVLLGISRTSKTPLSMFLANQKYKVANVPLVPEAPLPKEVLEVSPNKLFGLVTTAEKLIQIRNERLKVLGLHYSANYAELDRIMMELDYSKKIMNRLACPIIDVSKKAIEETASMIIDSLHDSGNLSQK